MLKYNQKQLAFIILRRDFSYENCQNYFQDPFLFTHRNRTASCYYVPCREEAEANGADMLKASRAIILNGETGNLNSMKAITRFLKDALKKLRIPQAMIPSRFQAAGRSLDTIRISIPMSAIRFLSIRLMCRMTTRQVSM